LTFKIAVDSSSRVSRFYGGLRHDIIGATFGTAAGAIASFSTIATGYHQKHQNKKIKQKMNRDFFLFIRITLLWDELINNCNAFDVR
jgi:hypothetical protein